MESWTTNSEGRRSMDGRIGSRLAVTALLISLLVVLFVSPVIAQDEQSDTEAERLEEVVVEGERLEGPRKGGGYLNEPDASSNLGIEIEDAENPFPTTSVNEQILEDQGTERFGESVRNVPGVFEDRGSQKFSNFVSRGYLINNRYGYLRNGLRFSHLMEIPMANVAKVEANKGPSSILNSGGTGERPAGSLNIVTKKPLDAPLRNAKVRLDQHGGKTVLMDYNEPVSNDFQYRINASYDNSDEFWDFGEREVVFLSGVAELTLDDGSKLTLDMQGTERDEVIYTGLPVLNGGGAEWADRLPIDRFIGFPNLEGHNNNFIAQLKYEKDLTENISFEFSGHSQYRERFRNNLDFNPVDANGDGTEESVVAFPGSFGFYNSRRYRQILRASLDGSNEGSTFNHDWVLGYEFEDFTSDFSQFRGGSQADGDTINVFNPDYSSLTSDFPNKTWTFFDGDEQIVRSYFFQDKLEGKGEWNGYTAVAGLRYDDFDGNEANGNSVNDEQALSPRFGLVYRPPSNKDISYYANWSESISPINPSPRFPNPKPERGIQREIGVKKRWYEGNLTLNASYYFTTRKNRTFADGSDTAQIGEEESKGIELDIRGKVNPQTTLIANYSNNQTEVVKDETRQGQDLSRTADNMASLWVKYSFEEKWEGIDVGGGFNWVDERRSAFPGALDLPSRFPVDLMASFEPNDRLKAQFNIKNLFDERYYTGSYSSNAVFPGQPLTLKANVTYKF